jgi:hypothetical protein
MFRMKRSSRSNFLKPYLRINNLPFSTGHPELARQLVIMGHRGLPQTPSTFTQDAQAMTTHRIVRIAAGFFVLLSLAFGVEASPLFVSAHWLWFTAFVGANLLQSGFTQFCPMDFLLKKLGVQECAPGRAG